jgi:hypothetical protein
LLHAFFEILRARLAEGWRGLLATQRPLADPNVYTWLDWAITCWSATVFGHAARQGAASLIGLQGALDPMYCLAAVLSALAFAWPLRGRQRASLAAARTTARQLLIAAVTSFAAAGVGLPLLLSGERPEGALLALCRGLGGAANFSAQLALFALLIPWWLTSIRKVIGAA